MKSDAEFTGLLPAIYDRHLGTLLFEPYAADVAQRANALKPRFVLEVAAGTGIVTEALARALPDATIEATDLNQAMIDYAAARRSSPSVRWSQADAMSLPFDDGTFDLVVCQFGAMFFPDCAKAFAEARRVLRGGGMYIVSVWDGLENNDIPRIVSDAAASIFPDDPPLFLRRTPYGHGDPLAVEGELRGAGFSSVVVERVERRSQAPSAKAAATGLVEGTPLRHEIEAHDARRLADVVDAAERALKAAFGSGPIDGLMSAFVFSAR